MASGLKDWQEKEFNDFMGAKGSAVVEFAAPWCATCKTMEPIISEVATTAEGVTFAKVDVSKDPSLASKMGVMSLPNILIIANGKVVDQVIGSASKSTIEEKIKKLAS